MTQVPMSLLGALEQRFEELVQREVRSKVCAVRYSLLEAGVPPQEAEALAERMRPQWEEEIRALRLYEAVRGMLPHLQDGIPPSHT